MDPYSKVFIQKDLKLIVPLLVHISFMIDNGAIYMYFYS